MNEAGEERRGQGGLGPVDKRPRKTRWRRVRWSARQKEAFLDQLAATCHIGQAAVAAGVPRTAAYGLRRRDATFAKGWGEALRAGYEVLELRLLAHALAGGDERVVSDGGLDGDGTLDIEVALKLLGTHRGAMAGKPHRGKPALRVATREETTEAILRKLQIVEARYRRADGFTPLIAEPVAVLAISAMPAPPEGAEGRSEVVAS